VRLAQLKRRPKSRLSPLPASTIHFLGERHQFLARRSI
jgi:hypothetical protein